MEKPEFSGDTDAGLSRRERQIMDAVYRLGRATATEIRSQMVDPPSLTATRTMITILENKGRLKHYEDGPRYVYEPVVPRNEAALSSLEKVLQTFFQGSLESAVSTLLSRRETRIGSEELERLAKMIEEARKEER